MHGYPMMTKSCQLSVWGHWNHPVRDGQRSKVIDSPLGNQLCDPGSIAQSCDRLNY